MFTNEDIIDRVKDTGVKGDEIIPFLLAEDLKANIGLVACNKIWKVYPEQPCYIYIGILGNNKFRSAAPRTHAEGSDDEVDSGDDGFGGNAPDGANNEDPSGTEYLHKDGEEVSDGNGTEDAEG